jgi:2-keto-4-pentenoate hydratase/2-oxohepta-3-ene-1,7-dioic acid hydratase in catechol pathway
LLDVAAAALAWPGPALPSEVQAVIEGGEAALARIADLQAWAQRRLDPAWLADPADVAWLTPLPPRPVVCAGRNFGRHLQASAQARGAAQPALHSDFPTGFVKLGHSLVPHRAQVARPEGVQTLDYEVELALVLGPAAAGRAGQPGRAQVFGYTVFNDLSAREWQLREMHNGMLLVGKNFPGAGPLGPCIVTADEVPDPRRLRLCLTVNGELRQEADCSDMLFGEQELLAFWARLGLGAGDLVATGTPAGVALHHRPDPQAWYLKPGDRVQAGVDGIGLLETTIV